MRDRSFIGMWRWVKSKKLRKKINRAATLKMCLKIDRESEENLVKSYCGTPPLNEDCPFFVSPIKTQRMGCCLAPNNDPLWHQANKELKSFISPTYERQNHMVVGCYIKIFNELGYANYNRVLRWKYRYEHSR